MRIPRIIEFIIGLVIALIIIYYITSRNQVPQGDVWYINLDRSPDRRKQMEQEVSKLAPFTPNRWAAVDGKKLGDSEYNSYNIPAWSRPSYAPEAKRETRKGEIGVYLSHRTLLEKLSEQSRPDNYIHIILEDDVKIDTDALAALMTSSASIGPYWDIIFIGLMNNKVNKVNNGIGVPEWVTGAHAYAIRHGSAKKVLNSIKTMYDPIDEMYGRNPDGLRMYALSPSKINQILADSTIVSS